MKLEINKAKILYIENFQIVVLVLVAINRVACTNGGPGGWSYSGKGDSCWQLHL
jgi:hypothetical protein